MSSISYKNAYLYFSQKKLDVPQICVPKIRISRVFAEIQRVFCPEQGFLPRGEPLSALHFSISETAFFFTGFKQKF